MLAHDQTMTKSQSDSRILFYLQVDFRILLFSIFAYYLHTVTALRPSRTHNQTVYQRHYRALNCSNKISIQRSEYRSSRSPTPLPLPQSAVNGQCAHRNGHKIHNQTTGAYTAYRRTAFRQFFFLAFSFVVRCCVLVERVPLQSICHFRKFNSTARGDLSVARWTKAKRRK